MRDDPAKNLKWLEQQLLNAEKPEQFASEEEFLMQRVDALLEDPADGPVGNFSRKSKGARAERSHIRQQFDESAAVLTKTRKQLRREARQRKKAKANHNRKAMVFLVLLEIIGILLLLGWWFQ